MSSKASVERIQAERVSRPWPQRGCGRHGSSGHLFGLDAERMSPKTQTTFAALAVLAPVALSGVFLVAFVPGLWWIFTTYFWLAFPAFGLLARGITGFSERQAEIASAHSAGERELLEALRREGEITSARAAMETSLSVLEADVMLKELVEAGHLEVRVRGGLFYAFWEDTGRLAPEAHPPEIP
jgi:hypothetical protein